MTEKRGMSVRTEKTIRLVLMCLLGGIFGILAVALDNQPLGYIGGALVLVGVLIGPLSSRLITGATRGGKP